MAPRRSRVRKGSCRTTRPPTSRGVFEHELFLAGRSRRSTALQEAAMKESLLRQRDTRAADRESSSLADSSASQRPTRSLNDTSRHESPSRTASGRRPERGRPPRDNVRRTERQVDDPSWNGPNAHSWTNSSSSSPSGSCREVDGVDSAIRDSPGDGAMSRATRVVTACRHAIQKFAFEFAAVGRYLPAASLRVIAAEPPTRATGMHVSEIVKRGRGP